MAEALPENGQVVALEVDPFFADFGREVKTRSPAWSKVKSIVGPAKETLQRLAEKARSAPDQWRPFDLVVIDADKAGMLEYFKLAMDSAGLISDDATVCIDVTPFRKPLFTRYVKCGRAEEWHVSAGLCEIEELRTFIRASGRFCAAEAGGLLKVQRIPAADLDAHPASSSRAQVSGKKRFASAPAAAAAAPAPSARRLPEGLSSGAHPLATFPNDHMKANGAPRWAAPAAEAPAAELRRAALDADWAGLFLEGRTRLRAEAAWCAGEARCARLRALCAEAGAKHALEVGAFVGVSTLTLAEALPADGQLTSLELDPFALAFGSEIKEKSDAWSKATCVAGPAKDSLERLAALAASGALEPFDFALVDADKAGMLEYVRLLLETPGLLSERATLCVDTTPFKGQLFLQYVRHGKLDDWRVKSGQEAIDEFRAFIKAIGGVTAVESQSLVVVRRGQ